jgi:shikimate dehydrogenase
MTRTITGATRVAGVVGHPIAHSLSPVLHNAWLEAAGIDGVYVPLEVEEAGFGKFIEGLRATSWAGLNVTLPFKRDALTAADNAHMRARRAQAANLLVFRDGRITADNTDGLGLLVAFAEQAPGFDPKAGRPEPSWTPAARRSASSTAHSSAHRPSPRSCASRPSICATPRPPSMAPRR